jgi:hypothetical protein
MKKATKPEDLSLEQLEAVTGGVYWRPPGTSFPRTPKRPPPPRRGKRPK